MFGDVRNLKIKISGSFVVGDKGEIRQGDFERSSVSLRHVHWFHRRRQYCTHRHSVLNHRDGQHRCFLA